MLLLIVVWHSAFVFPNLTQNESSVCQIPTIMVYYLHSDTHFITHTNTFTNLWGLFKFPHQKTIVLKYNFIISNEMVDPHNTRQTYFITFLILISDGILYKFSSFHNFFFFCNWFYGCHFLLPHLFLVWCMPHLVVHHLVSLNVHKSFFLWAVRWNDTHKNELYYIRENGRLLFWSKQTDF